MKKVVAITPPDAGRGFACCGAVQHVADAGTVIDTLKVVLSDPESGVVILDERLLPEVGEETLRELERQWPGVLVVMPSPGAIARDEDYAVRLIRRAIGYHVRVRT